MSWLGFNRKTWKKGRDERSCRFECYYMRTKFSQIIRVTFLVVFYLHHIEKQKSEVCDRQSPKNECYLATSFPGSSIFFSRDCTQKRDDPGNEVSYLLFYLEFLHGYYLNQMRFEPRRICGAALVLGTRFQSFPQVFFFLIFRIRQPPYLTTVYFLLPPSYLTAL